MTRARFLAGLVAGVALIAAACDDPTGFDAEIPVFTDTLSVFAMTGTPITYPSALNLYNVTVTRLEGGATFDVALDINAEGVPVLYPAPLVTSSPFRIGLRDTTAAFETVLRAPGGRYVADTALVLPIGHTAIVESQSSVCQFALSPFFYSKIVVDSIDPATRRLYLRVAVDPNCGFRSFEEGIPRN